MTFSEFGRRIFENGSNGTDHGKAAPTLFFGSGLSGSAFVGEHPSLDEPNNRGNLEYTMDFRDLYGTVLAEWLCVPRASVEQHLLGHPYRAIDLGFNCSGETLEDIAMDNDPPTLPDTPPSQDPNDPEVDILDGIAHSPYYPNSRAPHIHLEMPMAAHVDIELFNILGQRVGTIFNEMVLEGATEINIRERMRDTLSTGKYIYRISVAGKKMSKSVMIS